MKAAGCSEMLVTSYQSTHKPEDHDLKIRTSWFYYAVDWKTARKYCPLLHKYDGN
jgi:hypothetical protein